MTVQEQYKDKKIGWLRKHLSKDMDALLWALGYAVYVHAIDDIIDQDIPSDQTRQMFILRTFEYAEAIYSNHWYITHIAQLRPLVKMASNTYMDSVLWEKSPEEYKRKIADQLRCAGNELMLAIVEIVSGIDARREASLELRELSYKTHHTIEGEPC